MHSLLRHHRSQPLQNNKRFTISSTFAYSIPNHGSTSNLSTKSQSVKLIRRVTKMFTLRKKKLGQVNGAGGTASASRFAESRSPSPSASYVEEIRRPSGLGPRSSSVGTLPPSPSATQTTFESHKKERSRCISSPELQKFTKRMTIDWDALDAEVNAKTSDVSLTKIPKEVLDVILSFLSRQDLANFALVSKRLSRAALKALYTTVDLRGIQRLGVKKLLAVLATKQRRLDLVRTFTCRAWPASISSRVDPRTRHTTPPSSLSKFAVVLSNMRHVTSLILPSFEIGLLRHSVFRLHHLTFLNHQLSQEDYVELLSWLSQQPDLVSLSLPNLIDDHAPVQNGIAYQSSPCTPNPSLVSIPDQTSLSTVFSPFESPDSSHLLPSLTSLTATTAMVMHLAPARSLAHVVVTINSTLYVGLRPSALMSSLKGVGSVGLRFGECVDRRSVEKTLVATGAALGKTTSASGEGSRLRTLDIEIPDLGDVMEEVSSCAFHSPFARADDHNLLKSNHFPDDTQIYLFNATPSQSSAHPPPAALPATPVVLARATQRDQHLDALALVLFGISITLPAARPTQTVPPHPTAHTEHARAPRPAATTRGDGVPGPDAVHGHAQRGGPDERVCAARGVGETVPVAARRRVLHGR
jgi:hypothetical protein